MAPSLTDFKALSFDCYGTLIDWETGLFAQLQPLLKRAPADHRYHQQDDVISRFNELQAKLEREQPKATYTEVLASCYTQIASDLDLKISEADPVAFGKKVGEWNAFPDSVEGLQLLNKYYKLIILSNVDNDNVANTLRGPLSGVDFDAVLTAQDIGSYKPNHSNFNYLFKTIEQKFGLSKKDLLHTAKSLTADHIPAKELGLTSAWIARGQDGVSAMGGSLKDYEDQVAFTWRFSSIGEMAKEVEKAFATRDGEQ